jgi:hypothetical protein
VKKNENADLTIDSVTSRHMSHLAQARGAKTKSQTAQKTLWWIACPTIAVQTANGNHKIEVFCCVFVIVFLFTSCSFC